MIDRSAQRSARPAAPRGRIVAFRVWGSRGDRLVGASVREEWPAGAAVDARCELHRPGWLPHLAPAPGCSCGVHAVSSLEALRHYVGWHLLPIRGRVIGAVLLWSSPQRPVIARRMKGGRGILFRAPHARVIAIADTGRRARRVARSIGQPCVSLAAFEAFAREHGGGEQVRWPIGGDRTSETSDRVGRSTAVRNRVLEWAAERPPIVEARRRCQVIARHHVVRATWPIVRRVGIVGGRVLWAIARVIAIVLWVIARTAGAVALAWLRLLLEAPLAALVALVVWVTVAAVAIVTLDVLASALVHALVSLGGGR